MEIVAGEGLGLFNTQRANTGSGPLGQGSERIALNVANGNLILNRLDQILVANGVDLPLMRTYNSQGLLNSGNTSNFRFSVNRKITSDAGYIPSYLNNAIIRIGEDGYETRYQHKPGENFVFVSTDGDGAHDTLTFYSSTQEWVWTEGSTRQSEVYDGNGRLIALLDAENTAKYDGSFSMQSLMSNDITLRNKTIEASYFYYSLNGLLSRIEDASGQTVTLAYENSHLPLGTPVNLVSVTIDNAQNQTSQVVRYVYDSLDRLTDVIVDLSPQDRSIADNNVYRTTYSYDGTSTRIARLTQSDGTVAQFTYVQNPANGQYLLKTMQQGTGNNAYVTRYDYYLSESRTDAVQVLDINYLPENDTALVTAPGVGLGYVTSYVYDSEKRLSKTVTPPDDNGQRLTTTYTYDASDNVIQVVDAKGNATTYKYDQQGNQIEMRDVQGNLVQRSYNQHNRLLQETQYAVAASGPAATTAPEPRTTRYVYDALDRIRFVVDADGSVTETRYDDSQTYGSTIGSAVVSTLRYTQDRFDIAPLTPSSVLTLTTLQQWAGNVVAQLTASHRQGIQRTDSYLDFRGQLAQTIAWHEVTDGGVGSSDGNEQVVTYVYDQYGNLIKTVDTRGRGDEAVAGVYAPGYTHSRGAEQGLTGQYFAGENLSNLVLTRTDANVNFDAGYGAIAPGLGNDHVSARWTGYVAAAHPTGIQEYTFSVEADDGVRLWIDGQLIIDAWYTNPGIERQGRITLEAGRRYSIKLEYFDNTGAASAKLKWQTAGMAKQIIDPAYLFTAAPGNAETTPDLLSRGANAGLTAQYYDNEDLTNLVATRVDANINVDQFTLPASQQTFSVRWQGKIVPAHGAGTQEYRFATSSNDGIRVWVDNQLIIDAWHEPLGGFYDPDNLFGAIIDHAGHQHSGSIMLEAGKLYDIKVEYFQHTDSAHAKLYWATEGLEAQVVSSRHLYAQAPAAQAQKSVYETSYVYDGMRRLVSTVDAVGNVSAIRYDDASQRIVTTQANGLQVTQVFDAAGALLQSIESDARDPGNITDIGTTRYQYDTTGRLISKQDATGVKNWFLYDETGRQTGTVDGNGILTETVYDAVGNVIKTVTYDTPVDVELLNDWARADDAVVFLPFNEATGNSIANAGGGGGNASVGTGVQKGVAGRTNSNATAFGFNGTDGAKVIVGNSGLPATSGTLETWVKTSNAGSGMRALLAKEGAYGLFLDNNELVAYNYDGNPPQPPAGLTAEYYTGQNFDNLAFTRIDPNVNFDVGFGQIASSLGIDNFSIRWTGKLKTAHTSGTQAYTFYADANEGFRMWIDGALVINAWNSPGSTQATINLSAGLHDIKVEYREYLGAANAKLQWQTTGVSKQVIGQQNFLSSAPFDPAQRTGVFLNDNSWHHVAMVFDGNVENGTKIYVDGKHVLTTTIKTTTTPTTLLPLANGQNALWIGAREGATGTGFNGALDEVAVYDRKLSEAAIRAHALDGVDFSQGPQWIDKPSLYLRLDETGGSVAHDGSGRGFNGSIGTGVSLGQTQVPPPYANPFVSGSSAAFNGAATAGVTVANQAALQLNKGSLETWIKTANAGSGLRTIAGKDDAYGIFLLDNELVTYDFNATPAQPQAGLRAEYYSDSNFSTLAETRVDSSINFNAGFGNITTAAGADTVSVRWTGQIKPAHASGTQSYTFYASADDGIRVWVDGQLLIDRWTYSGTQEYTGTINLEAGRRYDIKVEYREDIGTAQASLKWSSAGVAKAVIGSANLYASKQFDPFKHTGVYLNDNEWHNVLLEFDNGVENGSRLLVDGEVVLQTTLQAGLQDKNFYVGGGAAFTRNLDKSFMNITANSFNGLISNVAIYDHMLTPVQIESHITGLFDTALQVGQLRPATSGNDRALDNIFDAAGLMRFSVDGEGSVTEFRYDAIGQLLQTITYDRLFDRTLLQNARGEISLAALQTAVNQAYPTAQLLHASASRVESAAYTADGKILFSVDAEKYLTEYRYDAADQLVETIRYATALSAHPAAIALTDLALINSLRPAASYEQMADGSARRRDIHEYKLYDRLGQLAADIDGEGFVTAYEYDSSGNLAATIEYATPLSEQELSTALAAVNGDAARLVLGGPIADRALGQIRPPASNADHITTMEYDGLGRQIRQTDYQGTITTTSYNAIGLITEQRINTGDAGATRTLKSDYDVRGLTTSTRTPLAQAAGTAFQYVYDAAGRQIAAINELGHKTLYFYDQENRLVYTINAQNEVAEIVYNSFGEQAAITLYVNALAGASALSGGLATDALRASIAAIADPARDITTVAAYNRRGQIVNSIDGEHFQTSFLYDALAQVRATTQQIDNQRSTTTTQVYDKRGLVLEQTADDKIVDGVQTGIAQKQRFEYDAFGRVTKAYAPNGTHEVFRYDRLGRQIEAVDASGGIVKTSFDAFDRELSVTNALGNVTRHTYDDNARIQTTITPENHTIVQRFNRFGEQISIQDANGNITLFGYDDNGNLNATTDDSGTITTQYDALNRAVLVIDQNNAQTRFTYDALDRVLESVVDYGSGRANLVSTYQYSDAGQTTTSTIEGVTTLTRLDRNGNTALVVVDPFGEALYTEFTYDGLGNQVDVKNGTINTTTGVHIPQRHTRFEYDALGRRVADIVDPNGLNIGTEYRYDQNDNLSRKKDELGNLTYLVYDDKNQLIFTLTPEGMLIQKNYDAVGNATATTRYGATLSLQGADLSDAQVRTQINAFVQAQATNPANSIERQFYDADNRETVYVSPQGMVRRYRYDGNGNVMQAIMYDVAVPAAAMASESLLAGFLDGQDARNITATIFDHFDRAVLSRDGQGYVTRTLYDATGDSVATISYGTPVSLGTFEQLRQSLQVADVTDMPMLISNALGAVGSRSMEIRDGAGRVIYSINAENYVTRNNYDAAGLLQSVTQYRKAIDLDKSQLQSMSVAGIASLLAAVPGQQSFLAHAYIYDSAGRAIFNIDARGYVVQTTYDARSNVTSIKRFESPVAAIGAIDYQNFSAAGLGLASAEYRVYDAADRIVVAVDALGYVTENIYDAIGNVLSTTTYSQKLTGWSNAASNPLEAYYNNVGDEAAARAALFSAIHATSAYTREKFLYDNLGRLQYQVDAEGYVTEYILDTAGNRLAVINYAEKIQGDVSLAQIAAYEGDKRVYRYVYDESDRVIYSIDGEGHVTHTEYDYLGNIAKTTAYGAQVDIAASATTVTAASIEAAILVAGNIDTEKTVFHYDATGRLVATINAMGYVTRYDYDHLGNKVVETRYAVPVGTHGVAVGNGDYSSLVNGEERAQHFVYDDLGNLRYEIDAEGYVKERRYNYLGKASEAIQWFDVIGVLAHYDESTVAAALGDFDLAINDEDTHYDRKTTFDYDDAGNITAVTDAVTSVSSRTENYEYDYENRRTAKIDRAGQRWTFTFDAKGQLIEERSPQVVVSSTQNYTTANPPKESLRTRYEYDARGNIVKRTEAYGRSDAKVIEYAFDGRGMNTAIHFPDTVLFSAATNTNALRTGLTSSSLYDAFGNEVAQTDLEGHTRYKLYDDNDRVTHEIDKEGYVTAWQYDAFGNAVSMTRFADKISTAWGSLNDKKAILAWLADHVAAWTATSSGRKIDYDYDALNRQTRQIQAEVSFVNVDEADLDALDFSANNIFLGRAAKITQYNAFDEVVAETDTIESSDPNAPAGAMRTAIHGYNKRGERIRSVDAAGYLTTWQYHADGNVKSYTEYATIGAADGSVAANDRTYSKQYNVAGLMIEDTQENVRYATVNSTATENQNPFTLLTEDITTVYDYDALDRVKNIVDAQGNVTSFEYDELGRLTQITMPSRSLDSQGTRHATPVVQTYYDAFGQKVVEVQKANDGTSAPQTSRFSYNAVGHLLTTVDAQGTTFNYGYDAQGNLASQWHQLTDTNGTAHTRQTFTTYDAEGRSTSISTRHFTGLNTSGNFDKSIFESASNFAGQQSKVYKTYNAFGEVTATLGNNGSAVEYFEYDAMGRLQRSNKGDGVDKTYGYDIYGNQVFEAQQKNSDESASITSLDNIIDLLLSQSSLNDKAYLYSLSHSLTNLLAQGQFDNAGFFVNLIDAVTEGLTQTGARYGAYEDSVLSAISQFFTQSDSQFDTALIDNINFIMSDTTLSVDVRLGQLRALMKDALDTAGLPNVNVVDDFEQSFAQILNIKNDTLIDALETSIQSLIAGYAPSSVTTQQKTELQQAFSASLQLLINDTNFATVALRNSAILNSIASAVQTLDIDIASITSQIRTAIQPVLDDTNVANSALLNALMPVIDGILAGHDDVIASQVRSSLYASFSSTISGHLANTSLNTEQLLNNAILDSVDDVLGALDINHDGLAGSINTAFGAVLDDTAGIEQQSHANLQALVTSILADSNIAGSAQNGEILDEVLTVRLEAIIGNAASTESQKFTAFNQSVRQTLQEFNVANFDVLDKFNDLFAEMIAESQEFTGNIPVDEQLIASISDKVSQILNDPDVARADLEDVIAEEVGILLTQGDVGDTASYFIVNSIRSILHAENSRESLSQALEAVLDSDAEMGTTSRNLLNLIASKLDDASIPEASRLETLLGSVKTYVQSTGSLLGSEQLYTLDIFDKLGRAAAHRDIAFEAWNPGAAIYERQAPVSRMQYDRWGNLTQSVGTRGETTQYQYDARNNVVGIDKLSANYLVVDDATLAVSTTVNGIVHEDHYVDILGRKIGMSDGNQNTSFQQLNEDGFVLSEVDGERNRIRHEYDGFGNETAYVTGVNTGAITNGEGYRTTKVYDANNRLTSVSGKNYLNEQVTIATFDYDEMGNRIRETDALGIQTRYFYDDSGNIIKTRVQNASGSERNDTYYGFDAYGNKIVEYNAEGDHQRWTYNTEANAYRHRADAYRNLAGSTTYYEYDTLGRKTSESSPNFALDIDYTYYDNGKLKSRVDNKVALAYDSTALTGTKGFSEFYYDLSGNVVRDVYWQGSSKNNGSRFQDINVNYDLLGRVAHLEDKASPKNFAVDYKYDAAGNRINEKSSYRNNGATVVDDKWFAYDSANRMTAADAAINGSLRIDTSSRGVQLQYYADNNKKSEGAYQFEYAANGLLTQVKRDGNSYNERQYFNDGKVSQQINRAVSGQVYSRINYTYDTFGRNTRIESRANENGEYTRTDQTFDKLGNLKKSEVGLYVGTSLKEGETKTITDYSYVKIGQYKQNYAKTTVGTQTADIRYYFNASGHAISVDSAYNEDDVSFINNSSGQVVIRNQGGGKSYDYYTYFGGEQLAHFNLDQGDPASSATISFDLSGHWSWYDGGGPGARTTLDNKFREMAEGVSSYIEHLSQEQRDWLNNTSNVSYTVNFGGIEKDHHSNGANELSQPTLVGWLWYFPPIPNLAYIDQSFSDSYTFSYRHDPNSDDSSSLSIKIANELLGTVYQRMLNKYGDYETDLLGDDPDVGRMWANITINVPAIAGSSSADFADHYNELTAKNLSTAPTDHTVVAGETLQAIAAAYYGDSSLWYVIAEANGISASASITAGQKLNVPVLSGSMHNNINTFKPYSASAAQNLPQPHFFNVLDLPPAPENKAPDIWGMIGAMIAIIFVAIIVGIFTAGVGAAVIGAAGLGTFGSIAAGVVFAGIGGFAASLASQAVAIELGVQDTPINFAEAGVEAAINAFTFGFGKVASIAVKAKALNSLARNVNKFASNNTRIWTSTKIVGEIGEAIAEGVASEGIMAAIDDEREFNWEQAALASAMFGGLAAGRHLASSGKKSFIVIPDGADDAVKQNAQNLARKSGREIISMDQVHWVGRNDKLYVVGHGDASTGKISGSADGSAPSLGADELAATLRKNGLVNVSKISMVACNSDKFADDLYRSLNKYSDVAVGSVAGRKGAASVLANGRKVVKDGDEVVRRTNKFVSDNMGHRPVYKVNDKNIVREGVFNLDWLGARLSKTGLLVKGPRHDFSSTINKELPVAKGQSRNHTISYDTISNGVIDTVNQMIVNPTGHIGIKQIDGLIEAVFPAGGTTIRYSKNPNLVQEAADQYQEAITARNKILKIMQAGPTTTQDFTDLADAADSLIKAANNSPDNLRVGFADTNSSIQSAIDFSAGTPVKLGANKTLWYVDPATGAWQKQSAGGGQYIHIDDEIQSYQITKLMRETYSDNGIHAFSSGTQVQSSSVGGLKSSTMSTANPTPIVVPYTERHGTKFYRSTTDFYAFQ